MVFVSMKGAVSNINNWSVKIPSELPDVQLGLMSWGNCRAIITLNFGSRRKGSRGFAYRHWRRCFLQKPCLQYYSNLYDFVDQIERGLMIEAKGQM